MNDTMVDPFNPQNIMILPLIFQYVNRQLNTPGSIPQIINRNDEEFVTIYFQNIALAISKDRTTESPELDEQHIAEMRIFNDQKKFFNQSVNTLLFTTYVKQFNAQQEKINTFGSKVIVALDPSSVYFSTSTLKLQKTIIDNGLLFENTYERDFLLDIQSAGQKVNSKFFSSVINLNRIKSIQYIQYPKVNEVLADTGSIVSILLLTSAFVIMTNQYFLESEAISQVINIFYPNLKQLKYRKNWYEIQIQYSLWQIERSSLDEIDNNQQNFDISSIQFILQSILKKQNFIFSHQIGIRENNFIECTKEENDQDNQDADMSKDSRVVPSNDSKLNISEQQYQQIQQTMLQDYSNHKIKSNKNNKSDIFQQQFKIENALSQQELTDSDFELLCCKKDRIDSQLMPQFFEINKIT